MSDAAKAKVLRGHSLALFGLFGSLVLGLAVAVGLPILLVRLLAFAGLWNFESALAATLSWPFLVAGLLPLVVIFLRSGRRREG